MVKLDANVLRYMSKEEFRVLTAIEMGQKNHELVPTVLICRIAGLKAGGAIKLINSLHKNKLIVHENNSYDGYRLTYQGYDYLALKTFVSRGIVSGIGSKIGVGKESDIYEVVNAEGESMVMKIHRLGRTSFRSIKSKRDYMGKRKSCSWLYLARLSALREYTYMKALHDHGFPVPVPIDANRHCIIMSKVKAKPFGQIRNLKKPGVCYSYLMNLIVKLAEHGLIHCDFNEFNLMLDPAETVTMIDFPQMVSTTHENAQFYFDRDVQCVRTYFKKRYKFVSDEYPRLEEDTERAVALDVQLGASGFSKEQEEEFDALMTGINDGDVEEEEEGQEGDEGDEGAGDAGGKGAEAGEDEEEDAKAMDEAADEGDDEGDEGDEEEEVDETAAERRKRKKALPPKKKKTKEEKDKAVKGKMHRLAAHKHRATSKAGSDSKRNTQKIFRDKEKKMIKNQMTVAREYY